MCEPCQFIVDFRYLSSVQGGDNLERSHDRRGEPWAHFKRPSAGEGGRHSVDRSGESGTNRRLHDADSQAKPRRALSNICTSFSLLFSLLYSFRMRMSGVTTPSKSYDTPFDMAITTADHQALAHTSWRQLKSLHREFLATAALLFYFHYQSCLLFCTVNPCMVLSLHRFCVNGFYCVRDNFVVCCSR